MSRSLEGLDVLVTDDHAVVRLGMRHFLEQEGARITDAATGEACLEKLGRCRFDVLVIDITLPRMSGIEVLSTLRERGNKLPVLVVSLHAEETYSVRVLKLGAQGYLPKSADPAEIVAAIRALAAGKRYLTAAVAEQLADSVGAADRPIHEALTNREFEIFRLLGAGRSQADAAALLGISPKTVSTLRERILRKTNLAGNMEIVRYCLKTDLA